jgi:signal transduction histidine kinase
MRRRNDSVAGPLLLFSALGIVVLLLVGVTGVLVLRKVATDHALDEAQQVTAFAARLVERRTSDMLLTDDTEAFLSVESVVFDAVLFDPVVNVRVVAEDGTIVYSNQLPLIGTAAALSEDERRILADGGVVSEVPDGGDRDPDGLVAVSTRIVTPDGGTPLLLQTDQRLGSLTSTESQFLGSFAPVLLVALVALALLLFPLAYVLARRVQRADRDREQLLERALDASARERRKLAGDLHDGPVQDLAGLSMQLAARAERAPDAGSREALAASADAVRESVRVLRAAIVEVYPPNIRQSGLGPALSDLTARLRTEGMEVRLDAPAGGFGADVDELLYRACQEGLRNVVAHAEATSVDVRVRRDGRRAVLLVSGDGRGVILDRADDDGEHLGLRILDELVDDAGGALSVGPRDGGGTVLRVEVPVPR